MATTSESYKIVGRQPRYTTKLSAFANGMYLTKQVIPEGYARVMVNYDIDDTGSNIKPRPGRKKLQTFNYDSPRLGGVNLVDYIYAYNNTGKEIVEVRDLALSFGLYTKLEDLVSLDKLTYKDPVYVSYMKQVTDNSIAEFNEDEGYVVTQPGVVTEQDINEFWALDYDKTNEAFRKVENQDLGYITARTIKNAYAFNKPFKDSVGRPISAVVNNEILAFSGTSLRYEEYPANPERNTLSNFGSPELSKLKLMPSTTGYKIKREPVIVKVPNTSEAGASGFNMLKQHPFEFVDEVSGSVTVLGALWYQQSDKSLVVLSRKVGTPMTLRVYYTYPSKDTEIQVKIEVLDQTRPNADFETLVNYTLKVKGGEPIYYDYTPVYERTSVRITLRNGTDAATEVPYSTSIDCTDRRYDNLTPRAFDLHTCKGMISWQGCLGLYGVKDAPNTIFFSDVENTGYFPFPYNIISLDNEILAIHNYLNHLIVITVDSVWLISAGTSIGTSSQKRILANVHIPEIDAINLVVLKDEIFFKTDTQFYVLKPNKYTSDSTDLKNYVNSTAIANYTSDFEVETINLLNEVYKPIWQKQTEVMRKQIRFTGFDVLDTVSSVKDSEVHYIYTIRPVLTNLIETDKVNLHLIYNTVTRSWRMYLMAIGGDDVAYNPTLYRNKQSGAYCEFFPHLCTDNTSSLVITIETHENLSDDVSDGDWHLTNSFNNFTYLDTGNVAIEDTFTKRFREVQFNLNNIEHTMINFFVDFKVDGLEQIQATKYELRHIVDPEDPDYGKIYVTPIESSNLDLPGLSVLADDITESDHFALDLSKFPELNLATIRFELKGRGRRASVQLLNTSLKAYELSDLTWVYRTMTAR